jgi:glutathione S-transferase
MLPILYSYRRCPYAMRARMALKLADIEVEIREVSLRDKPAHLLEISPKATVPVLVLPDGEVIDESLAIMSWAFDNVREKNNALRANIHAASRASILSALILINDTSFKQALDAYKYPERFPVKTQIQHRADGEVFLQKLEELLQKNTHLFDTKPSFADFAIFPFIRQFAAVDAVWFAQSDYPRLRAWLSAWVESDLFKSVMTKNPTFID